MNKYYCICLSLCFLSRLNCQEVKANLQLFYAINESQNEVNFAKTDSFIGALNAKTINLKLYGYADYLSHPEYNLDLSKRRADAIKNYLLKKYPEKINVLETKALGEKLSKEQNSPTGDAFHRRVDIILDRVVSQKEVDTRPITVDKPAEAESEEFQQSLVTKLGTLQKGKSITLEGLSFEPGRHYILKKSYPILEKLLSTLKDNPNLKIEIQGHICCYDGEEVDGLDYDTFDRKLSYNRSKMVNDYLVKNGIDASRLSYKGYGHSRPKVSPEKSPADEQLNRRVEILIIEN